MELRRHALRGALSGAGCPARTIGAQPATTLPTSLPPGLFIVPEQLSDPDTAYCNG